MESKNITISGENESKYDDNYNLDRTIAIIGDVDNYKTNNETVLGSLEELYQYSLGVVAHYYDSVYFMMLPAATAKYICDRVIHTKAYQVCCAIVNGTILITAQIYWYSVA